MDLGGQGKAAGLPGAAGNLDRRFFIAARSGLYLLMGALMACARVLSGGAPFGMAMVACSGADLRGVFALLGASAGYLLSGGLEWGIRYIAASVLAYTIAFVFHELAAYKSEYFMPTAAALVMGLTGFLGSFALEGGAVPVAAELFLELTLVFGGTYFFRDALSGGLRSSESAELKHSVSLMVLAACALMALSRVVLFGVVSLGRFLALLLVMTSAMKGGMLTGAAVGTVFGLAMDVSGDAPLFYTMAYAFAGLLSGVFGRHGRVLYVLSFVLAGAIAAVCAWESVQPVSALFETFCEAAFLEMGLHEVFHIVPIAVFHHVVGAFVTEDGKLVVADGEIDKHTVAKLGLVKLQLVENKEAAFFYVALATVFDMHLDLTRGVKLSLPYGFNHAVVFVSVKYGDGI